MEHLNPKQDKQPLECSRLPTDHGNCIDGKLVAGFVNEVAKVHGMPPLTYHQQQILELKEDPAFDYYTADQDADRKTYVDNIKDPRGPAFDPLKAPLQTGDPLAGPAFDRADAFINAALKKRSAITRTEPVADTGEPYAPTRHDYYTAAALQGLLSAGRVTLQEAASRAVTTANHTIEALDKRAVKS